MIFDDDGYYMASVLAELMAAEGREVWLATPATLIAQWTEYTLEQDVIEARLAEAGVRMLVRHTLARHRQGRGASCTTISVAANAASPVPA